MKYACKCPSCGNVFNFDYEKYISCPACLTELVFEIQQNHFVIKVSEANENYYKNKRINKISILISIISIIVISVVMSKIGLATCFEGQIQREIHIRDKVYEFYYCDYGGRN